MRYRLEIRYHNSGSALLRVLGAVSRRGLDLIYVHAEPGPAAYRLTLLLDLNVRQFAQLCREWRATLDVLEVTEVAGPVAPMETGDG